MGPHPRVAIVIAALLAPSVAATPAMAAESNDTDSARHQGMERMHEQMMSGDDRGMECVHDRMMSNDNPGMERMRPACMEAMR